jgi:molecular chaperone GrpE
MTFAQDDSSERPPAGPVVEEGSSSSEAAGEDPSPTPPTGDAHVDDAQGSDVGASPSGDELERDIGELLSEAEKQRDEYLELAKRTKADFENYRKRMAADVQAAAVRGKASVAEGMIDAVENLERALASEGIDESSELEDGFANGVRLVYLGMKQTLARFGIEAIDPRGETFDPEQHEALQKVSVEGAASGTVVDVIQKGIRLDEQLIRPARVVVAE